MEEIKDFSQPMPAFVGYVISDIMIYIAAAIIFHCYGVSSHITVYADIHNRYYGTQKLPKSVRLHQAFCF